MLYFKIAIAVWVAVAVIVTLLFFSAIRNAAKKWN